MSDSKAQLAQAALKVLAKTSWSELTLMQIARAANLAAADLQGVAPNRAALLGVILHWAGSETARRYRQDTASQDTRDRLLDVALNWFEVLASHQAAVRALYDGLKRDLFTLLAARAEIVVAAEWLLALAEVDTGPALPARALALAAIIARAIPVWLSDDAGMTQTMARLDSDLRRADSMLGRLRRHPTEGANQPPRSSEATEKAMRPKKPNRAGTRPRSRARNPARRAR